ncbi:MAG: redoxin domain-containing protein [Planctomycetes bacterium]|nr:redoxin domain-containing protein [Planctomycetota bacterium]
MRMRLSSLSFCALLAGLGCHGAEQAQFCRQVLNKPAPEFALETIDGGKVTLSEFRGKPVLVAFWAYG